MKVSERIAKLRALMAEKGIDVKVLQKIMGHSDISVTMNIYTHVTSDRLHEEIKKLEIAEIAR